MAHNRSELVCVEGEIEVAQNEGLVVFLLLGDHDVTLLGLPETAPISLLLSLLLFSLHRRLQLTLLLLAHLAPEEVAVGNGNPLLLAVFVRRFVDLLRQQKPLDAPEGDGALRDVDDRLREKERARSTSGIVVSGKRRMLNLGVRRRWQDEQGDGGEGGGALELVAGEHVGSEGGDGSEKRNGFPQGGGESVPDDRSTVKR